MKIMQESNSLSQERLEYDLESKELGEIKKR